MRYLAFVGTTGPTPKDAIEIMNRDLPGWIAEMDRRGVRLNGRELDFPDEGLTVRVRDGEQLVTDGPFIETKEFVAGFDVLDCADLDEAIEVAASSPVARFHPFEVRPVPDDLTFGPAMAAYARMDDAAGLPYLLTVWVDGDAAAPSDDAALEQQTAEWRRSLVERGDLVFGGRLGGPETATTIRVVEGDVRLTDGHLLDSEAYIAALDVVACVDRRRAIECAASHPMAAVHAVEARPFYSETAGPQVPPDA